jgi:asparagine synthase (glutamine-hydrolysing)
LQALARDTVAAYLHAVSVTTDEQRSALLSNELRGNLQDYTAHDTYRRYAAQAGDVDALSLIQYLDFKAYLAGDILTKVDRASMAHGLEVRVPLLDYTFVEWVATLPPSVKLRGQEGKYIFKKAAAKLVPREVIYRPKQGFAVPIASWFRGPLRERVRTSLTGPVLADCGLLDMKHVTQLVDQHQSGLRDHSAVLWALLMFEGFLRNVFK